MNTRNRLFAVLALGGALAGFAIAQTPGPAQPEPPPAPGPETAPAPAAGLVTSVNATSIKAVFDAANVPVEVLTTDKGYTYLRGKPQDYTMFVYPLDCEGNSLDGVCKAFAMETALWNLAIGPENANLYNRNTALANAVVYDADGGKPVLEYTVAVDSGVSADYVRTTLRYFTYNMKAFHQFLDELQSKAASQPAPSGFAAAEPGASVLSSVPRSGARISDAVTSGTGEFGTTTKVIKR